ncbi:MAG: hypothetical protein MMC23_003246 [Stictis urceolatum]|nr:hypothetical protein [Stictis urceolata]
MDLCAFGGLDPYSQQTIYPAYASLITSLLDIHLTPPTPSSSADPVSPTFEILEAGTGHGGLTLYLARALTAGNPPVPAPIQSQINSSRPNPLSSPSPEEEAYRASRSAALHTIDAEQAHSKFAQNVVRDFRRGIYYPVVDFHAGKVSDWLEQRLSAAEPRLLSHVILDLPSAHKEFALAEKAMQTAGSLLVFAPSITQLADCVRTVREERLGLVLERVLEVGTGMAGGREWDLREVRVRPPRSERRPKAVVGGEEAFASETEAVEVQDEKRGSSAEGSEAEAEIGSEGQTDASSVLAASDVAAEIKQGRREMVCRPKVGIRTSGGGFIGVWRKMRHKEDSAV